MVSIPIVTVVIPTYNRVEYLREAIDSVFAQTFSSFEVVVIDDGSSDGTDRLLSQYTDSRLRSTRLPGHSGPSAARNAGIRQARGELVAFLDDDDAYLPDFLARVVDVMSGADSDVGFCWCGIRVYKDKFEEQCWLEDCRRTLPSPLDPGARFRLFWSARQPGTNYGLTVRRDCFNIAGLFDERLQGSEDTDLLLRLVKAHRYIAIPEVLIRFREHGGFRNGGQLAKRALAIDQMVARHAPDLRGHPALRAQWIARAGSNYYQSGRRWLARRRLLEALTIAPWRIQSWRTWVALETKYRRRAVNGDAHSVR